MSKKENIQIGKLAAEAVLRDNFITAPPVVIHDLVENYGLTVFVADFENTDIAGYLDFDKRWIVVNRADGIGRQNFTIAHELGHWIIHHDQVKENEDIRTVYRRPVAREDNPLEIQANAFAAYLLVPDSMLEKNLNKTDGELSALFNVSQSVIGFRKANLNV